MEKTKTKKSINISAIQMQSVIGNKHKNFDKLNKLAKNVKDTDVLILPEVWNIGWFCEDFRENAEELNNSESINLLCNWAKEINTNIIGGSIITKDFQGNYYNTCPVINRSGELITAYNKMHLYSYYGCNEGKYIKSGITPIITTLDGVKFGLTICYDIRFPELYRAYRKAGADILVNCAAWANTKPIPWEMMTKSRAIENQTYMVAVNQYGKMKNNEYNLGHSRIIDYNGNVIQELLEGEGIIQAGITLEKMYQFREKCTILKDIKTEYEVKTL